MSLLAQLRGKDSALSLGMNSVASQVCHETLRDKPVGDLQESALRIKNGVVREDCVTS